MKKILLLIALMALSVNGYSQLSFSKSHIGPPAEFKKGARERFKASTTVFVVPMGYTKKEYEAMLGEIWTASAYKVVDQSEFDANLKEYLTDAFSFAWLQCDLIQENNLFYLKVYYDIFMLENEKMLKKIDKAQGNQGKVMELIDDNKINFARIPFQQSNASFEATKKALNPTVRLMFSSPGRDKINEAYAEMIRSGGINNSEIGYLKNNFQRLNKVINDGKIYWMYLNQKTPELKELKKTTLFVPDYIKSEFKPMSGKEEIRDDKEVKEMLAAYRGKSELVTQDQISQKIMNGEDFYYLKFTRVIASKFIEVINGKTGEVVYRSYVALAAYNIKDKDFENIKP